MYTAIHCSLVGRVLWPVLARSHPRQVVFASSLAGKPPMFYPTISLPRKSTSLAASNVNDPMASVGGRILLIDCMPIVFR